MRIEAWQGNQLLGAPSAAIDQRKRNAGTGTTDAPHRTIPTRGCSPEAVPQGCSPKAVLEGSQELFPKCFSRSADNDDIPDGRQHPKNSKAIQTRTAQRRDNNHRSDPPSEAPTDPEDWSEELAAIDLEVQRIGWDRDRERIYLERAFGHASRHRLTRYSDLVGFLRQLRAMQPGESPETAAVPLRRSDLLSQGDEMIRTMGWSSAQARDCLQKELGATSRQQLSDQQLMQFNMILENLMTRTDE